MTHWDEVALPILELSVSSVLEGEDPPQAEQIAQELGIEVGKARAALKLLASEGYVETMNSWGGPLGVTAVYPPAFRAVGEWPQSNNEIFGNALVEALEKLASQQEDESKQAVLREAASDVRSIGVNGAGQVLGSFLKGVIGLS